MSLLLLFKSAAAGAPLTLTAEPGVILFRGQDASFVLTSPAATSAITPKMGGWHGKRTFNPWEDREEQDEPVVEPALLRKVYAKAVEADLVKPGKVAVVEHYRRAENVSWVDMAKSMTAIEELKAVITKAEAKANADDEEDVADALAVLMEMF